MKILRQIGVYALYCLVTIAYVLVYMRMLLGPKDALGGIFIFELLYNFAVLFVGGAIAAIIAFLFILLDLFYVQKRLKGKRYKTIVRLFVLLGIALIVFGVHYLLEKVIDVI